MEDSFLDGPVRHGIATAVKCFEGIASAEVSIIDQALAHLSRLVIKAFVKDNVHFVEHVEVLAIFGY